VIFKTLFRGYATDRLVREFGYAEPAYVRTQYFVKEVRLFGFVLVYRKVLFREVVPNWAWIQQATGGYCDWRSDCPPDIWFACVGKPKG